jgi:hypothetical protein
MTTVKGNSTISAELKFNFEQEVKVYAKNLEMFTNGNTMEVFGSIIKCEMPKENIPQIIEKFIKLGTAELQGKGIRKMRALSVAKYTFTTLCEKIMTEI